MLSSSARSRGRQVDIRDYFMSAYGGTPYENVTSVSRHQRLPGVRGRKVSYSVRILSSGLSEGRLRAEFRALIVGHNAARQVQPNQSCFRQFFELLEAKNAVAALRRNKEK